MRLETLWPPPYRKRKWAAKGGKGAAGDNKNVPAFIRPLSAVGMRVEAAYKKSIWEIKAIQIMRRKTSLINGILTKLCTRKMIWSRIEEGF